MPLALLGVLLCVVYELHRLALSVHRVHLDQQRDRARPATRTGASARVVALLAGALALAALVLVARASSIRAVDARDRLIALLREHALVIGEVVLTSGAARLLLRRRQARDPAARRASPRSASWSPRRPRAWGATAVGGLTMGADPVACAALAGGFAGKAFFVRKDTKAHGLARRIEGPLLEPGDRCVVVEDVVSTGGSTLRGDRRAARGGPRDLRRDQRARPPDGRRRGDRGRRRRAVRARSARSTTSIPIGPPRLFRGRMRPPADGCMHARSPPARCMHRPHPGERNCPRQESNLDLPLRRRPSCPLDYEGAVSARFSPRRRRATRARARRLRRRRGAPRAARPRSRRGRAA